MEFLCESVLENIFSFSGGYNFINRQVCSDFRRIIPQVDHLAYVDTLLGDGIRPKGIKDSHDLLQLSTDKGYLNIFLIHGEGYVLPYQFCIRCARHGHLHMLKWAHERGHVIIKSVYLEAVKAKQTHVMQWLIDNNLY
nr:hypothetical protein Cduv_354 [Cedratvirus duvanny]